MSVLADGGFARAFAEVLGSEGGFTDDPNDDGNWTGGKKGVGELRGTKFGISAASYPTLDIKSITIAQARGIYYRDYWLPLRGPELSQSLAVAVFDCAVNQGRGMARICLQRAAGVTPDGVLGPATMAAVAKANPKTLFEYFQAERALEYAKAKNYPLYGRGWFRRLVRMAMRYTN